MFTRLPFRGMYAFRLFEAESSLRVERLRCSWSIKRVGWRSIGREQRAARLTSASGNACRTKQSRSWRRRVASGLGPVIERHGAAGKHSGNHEEKTTWVVGRATSSAKAWFVNISWTAAKSLFVD